MINMTNYRTVWRNPIRIGISIGIAVTYSAAWANGFDMVTKLFWGGITIAVITFTLFIDDD
jgi:hypothetical protein